MFDIQEELKKLPKQPGVYIMHDSKDAIIYVGKAVSLKNRVRSYFRASTKKTPKIQKMVSQIKPEDKEVFANVVEERYAVLNKIRKELEKVLLEGIETLIRYKLV